MPIHIYQTPAVAPVPPSVPPATGVLAPQADAQAIANLQVQAQVLTDQLSVLVGRAAELKAQIRHVHGPARSVLTNELTLVNGQISELSTRLANAQGQIDFRQHPGQARAGQAPPSLPGNSRTMDPDLVAGLMFAMIFAVFMPISVAFARRIWRRGAVSPQPQMPDTISPRLERLEQAVDAIAIEIERISESQRFVTKVLVERPTEARNQAQGESRDEGADAKPFRALGAGPIEPIRVAERQKVRGSITPH